MKKILVVGGFVILLFSCAGSGRGLDESGKPLDVIETLGGTFPESGLPVEFPTGGGTSGAIDTPTDSGAGDTSTLSSIQTNIFDVKCVSCHSISKADENLMLDIGNSFSELVNVTSKQQPLIKLVVPGAPDSSYLITKIEQSNPSSGDQMPPSASLTSEEITAIRQWITDGAQDN